GLGIAIPAGVVAVIEPGPAGQPIVVGAHEITDTPVGLPLELELGRAPGIWVRSRLLRSRERDRDEHIYMSGTVEVVVHNDKSESAIVEVRHRPLYSTFRLRKASRRFIRKSGDPTWVFQLPPGGHARFTHSFGATLLVPSEKWVAIQFPNSRLATTPRRQAPRCAIRPGPTYGELGAAANSRAF